jgi:hypothetical protein
MIGRNFDYGHQKSDSKEGQMARRSLLTMAKDLHNLYITLNDNDDLPEWCHYKLATSRKDLSDITDYLTSKVMKHCIDHDMSIEDIKNESKKSLANSKINELFFNKKKKPRKTISNRFDDTFGKGQSRRDYNDVENTLNKTIYFISSAKELAKIIMLSQNSNTETEVLKHLDSTEKISKINQILAQCRYFIDLLEFEIDNKKSGGYKEFPRKPKISSARKKQNKKWYQKLFSEGIIDHKEEIDRLIKNCFSYLNSNTTEVSRDITRIVKMKDEESLKILLLQLRQVVSILGRIEYYIRKKVHYDNERNKYDY